MHLVPAPEFEEPDEMESDSESSIYEDEVDVDDLDVEEPNVEIIEQSLMMDSSPMPPPPEITPLNDSYSGRNKGRSGPHPYKKRPRDYTAIMEENLTDDFSERPPAPPPHAAARPQQPPKKQRLQPRLVPAEETSPGTTTDLSVSTSSLDSILLAKPADDSTSKTSAPSVKSQHQPSATKKPQGRNSPTAPPAKQPTRSATRGRPALQTTDNQGSAVASRTPVTAESSSTTSSTATVRSKSTDKSMPPPPTPQRSPRRANSRLPLPRNANPLPPPQQSPLTMASIAAKLAASEREADAARVRAKLKAARLGKRVSLAPPATNTDTTAAADATRSTRSEGAEGSAVDPVKKELSASRSGENNGELSANEDVVGQLRQQKTRKRERRTEKVASRRRSTLNPWELETLIAGTARGAAAA